MYYIKYDLRLGAVFLSANSGAGAPRCINKTFDVFRDHSAVNTVIRKLL